VKHPAAVLLSLAVLGATLVARQGASSNPLEIWVVDVEGGKAAIYRTPTGQTAIVDTGFPGARDLDRIMAALTHAGITRIDYAVSTHYHVDHIGNLVELAKRVPIGTFVDHGPTVEGPGVTQVPAGPDGIPVTKPREQIEGFQLAYAELHTRARHVVVKPGDRVPITGVSWQIVTSAGKVLRTPALPGGGRPNPSCTGFTPMEGTAGLVDPDDAQSVGSVIILGQFRALDFGDLWRTKELELMCPTNPIGTVDLYFASSHGAIASGSLPFVHALQPRVALVQNGTRKGGAAAPLQTILSSPGLEALWQMHWSYNALLEQNSPGLYIANIEDMPTIAGVLTAPARGRGPAASPPPAGAPATGAPQAAGAPAPVPATPPAAAPGRGPGTAAGHSPAYMLKVTAYPDGGFTVTNTRNGFSKTYGPRR
jgi:beta-lactamase superfamily II metal-dependent hydrolase